MVKVNFDHYFDDGKTALVICVLVFKYVIIRVVISWSQLYVRV